MSRKAFVRSVSPETTEMQFGLELNYFLEFDDSASRVGIVHYVSSPGHESPPHFHEQEDEIFYVLEGEFDVYFEDRETRAKAGDCVFLPRGKPHAYLIRTPTFKTLIITQPANTNRLFRAYGELAKTAGSARNFNYEDALAKDLGPKMVELAAEHGLRILSPSEIREQLPRFPLAQDE